MRRNTIQTGRLRIPLGRTGHSANMVGAVFYLAAPVWALPAGRCIKIDRGATAQ